MEDIAELFPLLLVFIVLSFIQDNFPGWNKVLMYPAFLQNWLWPPEPFFLLSWSLAVEEWFYLLMPLIVLISAIFCRNFIASFLVGCILMGVVSCMVRVNFYSDPSWDSVARKVSLVRLDALAWGCVMAYAQFKSFDWFRLLSKFPVVVLSVLLALLCSIDVFRAFPNKVGWIDPVWLLALVPFSFSLLLPAAFRLRNFNGLVSGFVTNTSKWSYSLYLVHIPVIYLVNTVVDPSDSTVMKLMAKAISLVLSFAFAALIYRFYELPMMRLRPPQNYPTVSV